MRRTESYDSAKNWYMASMDGIQAMAEDVYSMAANREAKRWEYGTSFIWYDVPKRVAMLFAHEEARCSVYSVSRRF